MTLVLGVVTTNGIVMASDGYALTQDSPESKVVKGDFYSKITVMRNHGFLIGTAGSHELGFKIREHLKDTSKEAAESDLISSLEAQVSALNNDGSGRHTSLLVAYYHDDESRLIAFNKSGGPIRCRDVVALGAGADEALHGAAERFTPSWTIRDGVAFAIDSVFRASRCPTVNFVPMITYVTPTESKDLSQVTKSFFAESKACLRARILEHVDF